MLYALRVRLSVGSWKVSSLIGGVHQSPSASVQVVQIGQESVMKRIYVGNLPFSATEEEVAALFGQYGEVTNVDLITDRQTGRPRGFGFIQMEDDSAAMSAIEGLNGSDMGGRSLSINEARPREDRGGRR
jgi:RNA recognition motif-containing protein